MLGANSQDVLTAFIVFAERNLSGDRGRIITTLRACRLI